eukprot:TRINITY_DN2467_c0_g1_i1.p2 TRINITY_DN2467_c0_g1~~TRINITY_DN2467_c0_g1_i1.p2  ORF type:complete len:417 (+),score=203.14 TRINITY_DN2467_c0_g1_i1:51-1301(+)
MHLRMFGAALLLLLGAPSTTALYGKSSEVQTLDDAGLRKALAGPSIVLLEFFAPWCGHCRNLVPEMEKAAKALKGIVTVAAVDADAHKSVGGQYQVQGFPTIMLFGDDRKTPVPYNGGRTAKEMVAFSLREAGKTAEARLGGKKKADQKKSSGGAKSDVVELTDDNFAGQVLESSDLWMVEFYAPWCGHCKNLAPEWAAAATELKDTAKLGMVDATVHQRYAGQYGVQGYPTIKVFTPGQRDPEDYQGPRSSAGIVDYALGMLEKLGIGPTVEEATTKDALRTDCLEKKRICVVAILPHVMDTGASGRNKYIEELTAAAGKMRSTAFMWVSGGAQSKFEAAFGVEYNYPTFVAISNKKLRYATHMGRFDAKGIVGALKKIEAGKTATKPIKNEKYQDLFVKTEPWDGKDYVAEEEV